MKENKKIINGESGQIIVLLAVSLVVVMIVAALTVDGGMIYSERRHVQNAADAASLAGGGAALNYFYEQDVININSCGDSVITNAITAAKNAAQEVAGINNFPNVEFLGLKTYVSGSWTTLENEDADQGIIIYCNPDEEYIATQVKLSSQISTAFAHLIFSSPVKTTNIAITKTFPNVDTGKGNGIVSLSPDCANNTDGMDFTGTGDVTIYGGGVHSNSCLTGSGDVTVEAADTNILDEDGNFLVVKEGSITLSEPPATINGGAILDPSPVEGAFIEPPPVDVRGCSEIAQPVIDPKGGSLSKGPGTYLGIKMTNGEINLSPGTYCMKGDVSITGGTLTGLGVTFIIYGDFQINGNATSTLIAPWTDPDDYYYGMLIYMPPIENVADAPEGLITLVGNEESTFTGTIFAPTGSVEFGGVSSVSSDSEYACNLVENPDPDGEPFICSPGTFNTQIVAWYVKVVGTSQMDIIYDNSLGFSVPGNLYLEK